MRINGFGYECIIKEIFQIKEYQLKVYFVDRFSKNNLCMCILRSNLVHPFNDINGKTNISDR